MGFISRLSNEEIRRVIQSEYMSEMECKVVTDYLNENSTHLDIQLKIKELKKELKKEIFNRFMNG